MKRPAKLRTGSAVHPPTSSNSMLSRVPLLHVNDISLSAWDVGDQIPGLRIPLAFLSSLRTNLQISSSNEDLLPPSPLIPVANTSDFLHPFPHLPAQTKKAYLPRSTPNGGGIPYPPQNNNILSKHAADTYKKGSDNDDSQIPLSCNPPTTTPLPLTTSSATTEDDILSALRLVSDSVAQQRQIAVKCILTHPIILAPSIMLFLTIAKLLYNTGSPSDFIFMVSLWSLCSLLALLSIRYMVRGYSTLAERVGNWSWLSESSVNGISQRRDELLVAKCGEDIVAVLVLRIAKTVVPKPSSSSGGGNDATKKVAGLLTLRPRSSRRKSSARWTGIIRAWSVKHSHRHCGIGTRLLEEAVGYCRLRSLDGPVFADDHANATRVLPSVFHGKFLEHDHWARRLLEHVILEQRGR
ncbi:hypothetical protein AJ78_07079 [Emergomyces pasteurianus Ep9510]|uniref:N-acetyltransferase domain-containing protein n=1 Tax=Emergomyces pasteurianus Ep9510 TaxID=1447872 RepID=A0A1J9Q7Y5_9EURO|nr:hypothetical protein AJ78_07079 [Emergomyces pasteurianus Ep9510]